MSRIGTDPLPQGQRDEAAGSRPPVVPATEEPPAGDPSGEGAAERSPAEPAILRGGDPGWEELLELAGRVGPRPQLAHVDDASLERQVRDHAARLAAATCAWLDLVAELVVRGIWADQGARTPAVWLSWAVGMAPATAREQVRVALRLRELPAVRERFAAGQISYSKVRAITRVALPEREDLLLRWADEATGADLERIVQGYRSARRGRNVDAAELERHRDVQLRSLGGGRSEVVLRLPDDEAHALYAGAQRLVDLDRAEASASAEALVDEPEDRGAACAEAPDATDASGNVAVATGPRRSSGARLADAITQAVEAAVAAGGVDTTGADRHTLVVEITSDELVAGAEGRAGVDTSQGRLPALSRRILRRMACEAGVVPVLTGGDGTPLDVGRRERRLSTALRRALLARDRSCRFPGCGAGRHLHAHHIRHWVDGGRTDLANLVLVCAHHHRYVHAHDLDVRLRPGGGHVFRRPDGRSIPRARPLPGPTDDRAVPASGGTPEEPVAGPADALQPRHWDGRHSRETAVAVLEQEIEAVLPQAALAA